MFITVLTGFTFSVDRLLRLILTRPQVPIEKVELNDHLGPVFKSVEDLAPKGAHSKGLC